MGNQQTSQVKKNRGARASTGAVAPAIEVTEHNHFHAAGDGKGNPFEKYLYPFENLVFEGAGNRLLAYCGAVQVSVALSTTINLNLLDCQHNVPLDCPDSLSIENVGSSTTQMLSFQFPLR